MAQAATLPHETLKPLYVHGEARNGDDIIERWDFSIEEGGYFADRSAASQPIGVPTPIQPTTIQILGGVWVHPLGRSAPALTVEREEVFRGSSLGVIRAVAVDPDQRFVLALGDSGLYQVDVMSPGGPALLVVDVLDFPYVGAVDRVVVRDFQGNRTATLFAGPSDSVPGHQALLTDLENDGIFDVTLYWNDEEWTQLGFADPDSWDEDYLYF